MDVRPNTGAWQRPELRDDGDRHRSVGWLELFFDLIFVVIIAVLASNLEVTIEEGDAGGLLAFVIQFTAIFWVWNGFTYYTERFESGGIDNRLFTFIGILAVAGLAIWGRNGLDANYAGFAGAYLLARALNIATWLRAGYHVRRFRNAALGFTGGFVVATVLIVSGYAAPEGVRLALFSVAVVLEIFTPAITGRFQAGLPDVSRDRFPERFGLLTLIVLGEAVSEVIRSVAASNSEVGLTTVPIVEAALGLCVGFGLWWVYFDYIARRRTRQRLNVVLTWIYLHLVMLIGIVGASVGLSIALGEHSDRPLPIAQRAFLLFGIALATLAITAMELTLDAAPDEPTNQRVSFVTKLIVGVALIVLQLVLPPVPLVLVLLIQIIALGIPAAYGAVVWYRTPRSATSAE